MSSILAQYNPKLVVFSFDNEDWLEGIAKGTFITIARTNPRHSLNVGSDGNGTVVVNPDQSGVITLTLRAGSARNKALSKRMRDSESSGIPLAKALGIKDYSGESQATCGKAVLMSQPDDAFADTEGNVVWSWLCLSLDIQSNGSLEL